MYLCIFIHIELYSKSKDQPGKVANPAHGQLNRKIILPCPRSRLKIWSRETVSAVPSRASLLIFIHTQAESWCLLTRFLAISSAVSPIYLFKSPSGQSRVYRVTQLLTGGVHCREYAGKGPVSLKVVPNGCCASLSHTHCRYEVGVLKVVPA